MTYYQHSQQQRSCKGSSTHQHSAQLRWRRAIRSAVLLHGFQPRHTSLQLLLLLLQADGV